MPALLMPSPSAPLDPSELPLPTSLLSQPVIVISNDPRPGGMRLRFGPRQSVLTYSGFEHFAAILIGCPDPENLDSDFIRHDSASCEACNLRASVHRVRNCIEAAFGEDPDGNLARNVVRTIKRGKSYMRHHLLHVQLAASAKQISPQVLRPEILARLLDMHPLEDS